MVFEKNTQCGLKNNQHNHLRKWLIHTLVIFCMLFSNTASSQQIDSMMSVYAERLSPEKIHIHFDKSLYNKGETVWYKIYILQRGDTASRNVYLVWYDSDGKWITQTSSPLVLSTASGSFTIPGNYNGESLQVKAFTSWMLNDDPAFSYQRQLIINTGSSKKRRPVPFKTTVETFPEGGFLIEGLHTRLAFKASNQYGNPVLIRGVLANHNNHILDSLKVEHDGMGSFYFIPEPGSTYHLNWIDEYGVSGTTPIIVTKTEGASLSIKKAGYKAQFQIKRTDKVKENFKKMNLLVHMNQVLLYQVAINISEKTTLNSELPVNELPTGLLQFTLFTSDWIPIAERVVFINNGAHEFTVKVKAPLINVEKRGKNTLELFVPDTLFTNMSLSITDADLSPLEENTIFSDMLLSSEIKGKIYKPGYYLSGDVDSVSAHLDLVMLTNGWRRFDWDKIKAQIGPKIDHPIENEYMTLIGKVLGTKNGKASELNMIIVNKDSSRQFVSVGLRKDGSFEHPAIFFDTAKIIYSINNNPSLSQKTKLQIQNGLLQLSPQNIQPLSIDVTTTNDIQAKQKLDVLLAEQELLRKKMAETTLKEVTVTTKVKTMKEKLDEKYTSGFFKESPAKKAYILDMSDPNLVTSAQNVIEYLMNRIPGLVVSAGGSMQWRGHGPVLYLNEMRTDLATIRDIPLLNIAMIKAFPPIFMFATGGGAGGAVAVYTKMGFDYTPPELPGLQSVNLAGYTQFKEFYNPTYEQPDNGFAKPDNRSTLYWNPVLITNTAQQTIQVDFFNNDFSRTFNVVLEGVNAAGKMARRVRRIDAKTKVD
jgi:hypothetical protein